MLRSFSSSDVYNQGGYSELARSESVWQIAFAGTSHSPLYVHWWTAIDHNVGPMWHWWLGRVWESTWETWALNNIYFPVWKDTDRCRQRVSTTNWCRQSPLMLHQYTRSQGRCTTSGTSIAAGEREWMGRNVHFVLLGVFQLRPTLDINETAKS